MTHEQNIDDFERLIRSREDMLRRSAAKSAPRYSPPTTRIIATYSQINDGDAFHTQDYGWRVAANTLMEAIRAKQQHRPGRNPAETDIHERYDAMTVRQLAYPFLAAWRLSVEVAIKETLLAGYAVINVNIPSAVRSALRGHDIAYLWKRYTDLIPRLTMVVEETAQQLGVDAGSPGIKLDPAEHASAIGLIVSIDPDGQSLRYRLDQHGENNMADVVEIDLTDTHNRLTGVYEYLQFVAFRLTGIVELRQCRRLLGELRST